MSTNRERFQTVLADQFSQLFDDNPAYSYIKTKYTPVEYAARFTEGLITNTADKDGVAVKRTWKALGINNTYKAIRMYLG